MSEVPSQGYERGTFAGKEGLFYYSLHVHRADSGSRFAEWACFLSDDIKARLHGREEGVLLLPFKVMGSWS